MAAIPYETPSTLVMIDNGNGDEKGSSIDSMAIQSKPLITANDDDDGASIADDDELHPADAEKGVSIFAIFIVLAIVAGIILYTVFRALMT